jgi:hypothetical protein
MKSYMKKSDAVEGCRINHYRFDLGLECDKIGHGIFGPTFLKGEPVLGMNIDLPYPEDAAISLILKNKD